MAEADKSAGDPNAPREVETDAPSEQESAVRPTPVGSDRGWWDETAAAIKLPPLPVPPGSPPGTPPPTLSDLQLSLPGSSGGRTPADVGTFPPRPVPTVDPRPITAADLEDEARPPFVAGLLSTRPTSAWLSVGMVAVGVAFVGGLILGRGRTAAHTEPVSAPRAPAGATPALSAAAPLAATPSTATGATTANAPNPPDKPSPTVASASAAPPAAPSAPLGAPVTALTAAADPAKPSPKPALEPFNAKAARTNLSVAVARAQRCREPSAPAGSVSAVVTFVASGRVADVTVITPSYAGTRTGKCIISKLKTAQVPPFAGEPETMKKTFTLR